MNLLSRFVFLCTEVWKSISLNKKKLFYFYIFLSVIIAVIDLLSITSLMNVVGYATSSEIISREKLNTIISLKEYSDKSIFVFLSIFFVSITVVSIFVRFIHGLVNAKISHGVIFEFNQLIFKKLVYLNLLNNKKININTVTSTLTKVEDVRNVVIYGLTAISSIIIALGIFLTLLFIDIKITFFSLLFFLTAYLLIVFSIKKRMLKNSKEVSENIALKVNTLSSLVNNIRNVVINNLQFTFLKNFSDYDFKLTRSKVSMAVISFMPSIIIINLVLVIIVGYLLFLVLNGYDFLNDAGKIAAIALGAQKLNPLINSIYLAVSRSGGSYHNIKNVIDFIKLIKTKSKLKILNKNNKPRINKLIQNKINFQKTLKLERVNFRHNIKQKLIENLNLTINKNDKIIILGESGSGKSTLLDILTGLIKPDRGVIKLDSVIINKDNLKAYQKKISLITQNIFLEEGTLLKNITNISNSSDVDFKLLKRCCEISEINNFINKNKNKYKMYISHNGTNLSGGQKQRIAIARALYKNADILIFDETTSEIDVKIETKILNNFSKHMDNKTIIFVTHKVRKMNFFNKRYIIEKNRLVEI